MVKSAKLASCNLHRRVRGRTWERYCHLEYSIHREVLDLVTLPDEKYPDLACGHDSGFIAYSKLPLWKADFKKFRIPTSDSLDTSGRKPYPERKSCGLKHRDLKMKVFSPFSANHKRQEVT